MKRNRVSNILLIVFTVMVLAGGASLMKTVIMPKEEKVQDIEEENEIVVKGDEKQEGKAANESSKEEKNKDNEATVNEDTNSEKVTLNKGDSNEKTEDDKNNSADKTPETADSTDNTVDEITSTPTPDPAQSDAESEQGETEAEELLQKKYTDKDIIASVQEALNAIVKDGKKEYDCGEVDGDVGENTKAAIKKYKNDNGLKSDDGSITEELLQSLKVPSQLVRSVQEALNAIVKDGKKEYDCGEADGIAGEGTTTAITNYKKNHNLTPADGSITDDLLKALNIQVSTSTPSSTPAPTPTSAE